MARRGNGFDKASAFSLLEHADEEGMVNSPGAPRDTTKPKPAAPRPAQQQQQQQQQQQSKAGGAAGASQQARAEDYYRAFEHVYEDPSTRETVLRFHKTNIVRIRPNGDMMVSTGGWFTATTVAALNDALQALDMRVTYQPPVSSGKWILTDDVANQYHFKDGMVLRASLPEHKGRGARLLRAYNGGLDVPRYARKPAPGQQAAARQPAPAGTTGPAAGRPPPPQQQQGSYQRAAVAGAGPKPAGDIHEQLAAAMQQVGLDHDEVMAGDEHVCVVCLDRPRDEVLVPCGHMVLCHQCCADVRKTTNACPMCRETIEDHCQIDPSDM